MARSARRKKRSWLASTVLVVAVACVILLVRLVEEIGPERGPEERFRVVRVIDGDTVELLGGDKLRLLAVDTPERGEPLYDEAVEFLKRHALDRVGEITYGAQRRDRYGRMLGYLLIDTIHINRAILDSGFGCLYLFKDNELESAEVAAMLAAQGRAIDARRGIWGIEHEPEPEYVATAGSFRFHRPGCRSVAERKPGRFRTFATREEALKEGLSPCRNCKP
jgi:endonuclease YncB( thermonuclease family)